MELDISYGKGHPRRPKSTRPHERNKSREIFEYWTDGDVVKPEK